MGIPQTNMPTLYEFAQDQHAFELWKNQGNDSDPAYRHLMNAFRVAIRDELTEQQRTYIMAYYFERLTMEEVSERFAVNKSTVSRTIKRAEQRLQRVLRYAHPRLLDHPKRSVTRKSTCNTKKRRQKTNRFPKE